MAGESWTIKKCLDWTNEYLGRRGIERPRLSAEWLLTAATGLSRVGLYTDFDRPLSEDELSFMHDAVVRRAKGEPLQYITGETTFRMIDVACEPGVLIPRPETEVLVDEVLAYLDADVLGAQSAGSRTRVELPWNAEVEAAREEEAKRAAAQDESERVEMASDDEVFGHADADDEAEPSDGFESEREDPSEDEPEEAPEPRRAHVLEVGCGTGCISLSLATERAGRVTCVATDIEPRAVALAIKNRDALDIAPETVDIRLGNLVSPLDRESEWGAFDVLVSNPPYIPSRVMGELPHEVADFEPALALDGGDDGLDIFRRLLKAAPYMLRTGGLFACELFEGALDEAARLCEEAGMADVRIVYDLTDRPRIVLARVAEAKQ